MFILLVLSVSPQVIGALVNLMLTWDSFHVSCLCFVSCQAQAKCKKKNLYRKKYVPNTDKRILSQVYRQ